MTAFRRRRKRSDKTEILGSYRPRAPTSVEPIDWLDGSSGSEIGSGVRHTIGPQDPVARHYVTQ